MRILVVEDHASLAKQLASSMTKAGYAVDRAADGERADFLAHTEPYDATVPRARDVTLDPRLSRVTRGGDAVKLTSHEFRVFSYLLHHYGRIVSQAGIAIVPRFGRGIRRLDFARRRITGRLARSSFTTGVLKSMHLVLSVS
jgi:DNA-binding response OmpR family regulator